MSYNINYFANIEGKCTENQKIKAQKIRSLIKQFSAPTNHYKYLGLLRNVLIMVTNDINFILHIAGLSWVKWHNSVSNTTYPTT